MLRIRFKRAGKRHQPTYRLVVSERARTPFARAKEDIGWYNPHSKEAGIDKDRAKYWLSVGAQPSDTVHNLFVKEGVIEGKKISVHSQPKKSEEDLAKEAEAAKAAEAPADGETPAEGDAPEAAPAEDAPAEQVKAEEVPSEEKKEEAPVEEKPSEEAKAEEAPTEEKKEEAPQPEADQPKAEAEEKPAEEASATDEETADKKEE